MSHFRLIASAKLVVALALLLSLGSTSVLASPLSPGSLLSPAPAEVGPVGASLLASTTQNFLAPSSFSGTLVSKVWTNDTSSPFGVGLTFTYELIMDPNPSAQPVSRFTLSSYQGFLVDASYTNGTAGLGVPPLSIGRNLLGDVIRFTFEDGFGNATLLQGMNSRLLVLQTDATYWQNSIAGVIDGATANVATFAPAVIPEPSSMLLGAAGLVLLLVRRGRPPVGD